MDHEKLREALSAYRDGELSEADRLQVAAHLGACPDCRGALARWERVAGAMLRPPRVEAREGFVGGVLARIAEEHEREEEEAATAWGWWLTPGFALALGLVVLLWPDAVPSTELLLSDASALVQAGAEGDVLALLVEEEP